MTAADRFRSLAAGFTSRAEQVADWEAPAPCEGWVARDVVRHLVEWMPHMFLGGVLEAPSVDTDPVGAWLALRDALQASLDDPESAAEVLHLYPGDFPRAQAMEVFGLMDVLVHTWDLARAAGLDEQLDPDEVHGFLVGTAPMDDAMRGEHFGPKVPVPDDADEQTRLIAFTGRTP